MCRLAFWISFIIAMILASWSLSAQEKWTLNDCISYAMDHNLELRQYKLNKQMAIENLEQSKWNLLPSISAGSSAGINFGRSVDPNTNDIINTEFFNNSYNLNASVSLFNGFMLQNQIKYQKYRKEATENELQNNKDDLAFEVMNAFYDVIYFQGMLVIAKEQKRVSELNVKMIEKMANAGLRARTDLLEVRANLEKEELTCVQIENQLASAWVSLRRSMNLGIDQELELVNPEEIEVSEYDLNYNAASLFEEHIKWSPYIRSYENEWKASLQQVHITKAEFLPSISLGASYNTGFYETNKNNDGSVISFGDQWENNKSQSVGATLSIPIFRKNTARFDLKKSKITAENAKTRLEQEKQRVLYEIIENNNDLRALYRESIQSEKQLEADSIAFQSAERKYSEGLISIVEFYTVKNRLANSTSDVLRSGLQLKIRKRYMDFFRGERFWEILP